MTSPDIKVKFFEHEDNPLPEDGSVHVITTGDGFGLRLGLWPVPGFKISIAETAGGSEPAEDTAADAGNEAPGGANADPSVSSAEIATKSEGGENNSPEEAAEPDAGPHANGESPLSDGADKPPSANVEPGDGSSGDGSTTVPSPVSGDADSDIVATKSADEPDRTDGNIVNTNRDDKKPNEAIPDQTEGSTDTGALVEPDDAALLNAAPDAAGTNTGTDPDAGAESADVTDAADQSGHDDVALKPDVASDQDDKNIVASATSEPVIAEDTEEQVEEKDVATAEAQENQEPVAAVKSEPVLDEGEGAPSDAPPADDQPRPDESSQSPNGPPPADTLQPVVPLEQAITMSGTIIVLNGRSEFIEKYAEVIRELIDRGFCVAALDWRGQGGSERLIKRRPLKGHVDDMDSYVEDLITLLDFLETTNCPKPYYCLAHSTGGQVLLRAAPLLSSRISRAVTTAPFLDLASYRTPKPVVYAFASTLTYAGLGEMYAPGAGRNPPSDDPFEGNAYSSDPRRYQRTADLVHKHKELAIGGPTVSWMYAALKSAGELFDPDFLSSITLPVMMLTASDDRVVSVQAVENFASMARTVSHLSIPGARHEILMERDEIRSQFWAAFDAFIPGED